MSDAGRDFQSPAALEEDRIKERIVVRVDQDLEELIPKFLANQERDRVRMFEALKASDYLTLQSIAHNMKGAGGGYGIDALTVFGAALEAAAKQQDTCAAEKVLDSLKHFLDHLEVQYVEMDD